MSGKLLHNSARASTAELSCHEQNLVALTELGFGRDQNRFKKLLVLPVQTKQMFPKKKIKEISTCWFNPANSYVHTFSFRYRHTTHFMRYIQGLVVFIFAVVLLLVCC